MKLQVILNQKYKSFNESFNFELEGNLVILSGINGGGKSQLINIINHQEGLDFNLNIKSSVLLDGVPVPNSEIAYRSFKDNISIPPFGQANSQVNVNSRNQVFGQYSSHRLNPDHPNVRGFKKSCLEANALLKKEFGDQKFNEGQITAQDVNSSSSLNLFTWKSDDIFTNIVSDLFFYYALKKLHARAEAGDSSNIFKQESLGIAPWTQLNQLFEELGFEYRFKDDYNILTYSLSLNEDPKLYQTNKDKSVDFSDSRNLADLSEGEKAIISFAFSSLTGALEYPKKILLLDEFDATLNPSLSEVFYKLLYKYFISKGVFVVMATHSPVTISLAPENTSFYEVFDKRNGPQRILSVQRENYKELGIVNKNFYNKIANQQARIVELNEENKDLLNNSKKEKNQLYLEGTTDLDYLRKASELLGKTELLSKFELRDGGGKDVMRNTHKRIKDVINKIPINAKHVFLFDSDVGMSEFEEANILFRRVVNFYPKNKVQKGVENLFPKETFEKAVKIYPGLIKITKKQDYNLDGSIISEEENWIILDDQKRNFCNWVCKNGTKEDFVYFLEIFDKLDKI